MPDFDPINALNDAWEDSPEEAEEAENSGTAQVRAAQLQQRAAGTASPLPGLLPEAFAELDTSIEELRVAEEEMRAQNEELLLARQHLEAERQRYRDLFEFAPDGYLVTTVDGQIREANRAAARLLNITPRFLKKRSLVTLVAPQSLTTFNTRLQALSEMPLEGPAEEWIVSLRRRPSLTFPAALTATRFPALLGEPPTLRWLLRDITERRGGEEERLAQARAQATSAEAEAAQQRLSGILDTITDQFVTFDTEWRFTYLNASARRLVQATGRDPQALIGQVIWEAYPTALGTSFQTEALRAVALGQMVQFEEFSQGLGRWLQVRVFPSENGVAAYSHDVTESKETKASLQAAYDRERRITETLQGVLLHTAPAEAYPGLSLETFCEAASEEAPVGGDFFDVFTFGDGQVALVVGDVTGKGLAAAALTAQVKYALRVILREVSQAGPALARVNDFLCEAQRQGDLGSGPLVVLSLVLLNPQTGELTFSTGGGEALLLVHAEEGLTMVETDGLLLGVQSGMAYTERQAVLAPGDTLLLVTDGLTEARRDGVLLGSEALAARAAAARTRPTLRGMGEALLEEIRAWTGGTFQDDVCLLLARRAG